MIVVTKLKHQQQEGPRERFHAPEDRARFVIARGNLRLVLAKYIDERPEKLRFANAHDGSKIEALAQVRMFRRVEIACGDHTFTSIWAQHHVSGLINEHLPRCQA
jgi:hypothetical protein